MIELGRKTINNRRHLKESRTNLYNATEVLGFNALHSSRLAIAYSEIVKKNLIGSHFVDVVFYVNRTRVESKTLKITLICRNPVHFSKEAESFFDFCNIEKNEDSVWISLEQKIPSDQCELIEERVSTLKTLFSHLSRESLLRELKIKNEDMKASKVTAEEATKAKSDFLANMSHEIRTPMNAIVGLNHLMLKTDLTVKQRDYADKIYHSTYNLLGIVNDILDFSKIEAGKMNLESINFKLSNVFDDLANIVGMKSGEKNLELIFDIDPEIPDALIGDPLRLGQILLNYANNAVKFTNEGEIVISVLLLEKTEDEVFLRFQVKDTGIGLKEKQKGQLFQAFTQADTSTTREYGGSGLGLTICKNLVDLMQGEIGVDSEFGKGSLFYFTTRFPIQKNLRMLKKNSLPGSENLRVLIVDDNITVCRVLKHYLEDFGISSDTTVSGQDALKLIVNHKEKDNHVYDLILLDYQMPELNGFETYAMIKDFFRTEDPPLLCLITEFGREDIIKEAKKSGFDRVLIKPVSQSILLDIILQILGQERIPVEKKRAESMPKGFDRIRGSSILLSEDNDVNQQIAREILELEGLNVTIASNGLQALEAIESNKVFDLVLMDLQMPILDGYKTTEKIREQYSKDSLPIIALTADSVSGIRNRAFSVGMNDFITKPLDPSILWNILVKWIKPRETKGNDCSHVIPDNEESEKLFSRLSSIDYKKILEKVGGKYTLLRKLLVQFADEFSSTTEDLENSLAEKNYSEAHQLIHKVKGVSGNLCAEKVYLISTMLEKSLIEECFDPLLKKEFQTELSLLFVEIRDLDVRLKELSTYN